MATTIGDLAIRIGADTTGLMTGLDKSSSKLDQFGGKVRSSANDLGKYAAAAAAAGLAIGAALVTKQLAVIDSLAKTSDKLGITTEALSGLQHASELTGASATTLEKGLRTMARGIAEAAGGTGLAKDAIDQLGLSAQALEKLSPDQQFSKIADAMNGVTNASQRLSLASDIFGGRGTDLLNTLALGSKGLAEMQAEADKLGISLSRVQAAQVEAANDALTRSGAVMQGVVRRATIDLAPLIEAVANEFTNAAMKTDNFGTAAVSAVQMIMTPIGVLLDGLHGIKVAAKGVEVVFKGLGFGAVSSFNMIVKGYTELANLIPGIDIDFQDTFLGKLEQSAADATTKAAAELHELAMTKIPSEQIDDFLARIENASKTTAQAVEANRALISGGGGGEGGIGDKAADDKAAKERERMQAQLQAVQDQFKTEQELLAQKVEADHIVLAESLAAELLTKEEYWTLEQKLKADHESQLTAIEDQAAKARGAIAAAEAAAKKQAMNQMFTDLASLMGSGSRKMFEIGKAAAIGQTILSTIEGAQQAYKAMAGIPVVGPALGIAAAAAATASGMARVSAIKSTQFGSTTANTGAGGGLSAPAAAATSAEAGATGGGSSRIISVQGISPDTLISGRMLVDLLNQAQEDGARLVIS